jgi:ferrous iron transport protein A
VTDNVRPLTMLAPGEDATVVDINAGPGLSRRLATMGLHPGMKVRLLQAGAPGPLLVMVGHTRLCLSRGLAHKVMVS